MDYTKQVEDAIDEYIRNDGTETQGNFSTGWVVVAAVSSNDLDSMGHSGYITITSDGLPHHIQLGLLTMALQEKQAAATISNLYRSQAMFNDEEDE